MGDSPKWVKSKKRRKKKKKKEERLNNGDNNGQATHGWMDGLLLLRTQFNAITGYEHYTIHKIPSSTTVQSPQHYIKQAKPWAG